MTRKKYGTYFAHQVACCITIFIFSMSLPQRIMECPSSFIFIKDQQRPMEFMKYGEMEESCLSSFWHDIVKCPLYLAWFFVFDHHLLRKQNKSMFIVKVNYVYEKDWASILLVSYQAKVVEYKRLGWLHFQYESGLFIYVLYHQAMQVSINRLQKNNNNGTERSHFTHLTVLVRTSKLSN